MANTAAAQAPIGNGQTLNADAARYWFALVARIKVETGFDIVATEGTRQYARQKYLYDGYRAGKAGFNPAWSPDSPFAYHLSGRAVDVGSGVGFLATAASRAFYALAGQYGFRPTVQGETWHFEWRADWVGVSLETASVSKTVIPSPPPPPLEDDAMLTITNTGRKNNFLIGKHYVHVISDADLALVAGVSSLADEVHKLTDAQTATVFAAYGIPDKYRTNPALLTAGGLEGYWSLEYANARDLAFLRAKLGA